MEWPNVIRTHNTSHHYTTWPTTLINSGQKSTARITFAPTQNITHAWSAQSPTIADARLLDGAASIVPSGIDLSNLNTPLHEY